MVTPCFFDGLVLCSEEGLSWTNADMEKSVLKQFMRHCKEESVECVLLSPRVISQTLRAWLLPPAEYLLWQVLASQLDLF